MERKFLILLIFALSFSMNLISQPYNLQLPILTRNTTPFMAAIGGAGVAISTNDATAFSNNPASLGYLMRNDNIILSYNTNSINLDSTSEYPYSNFAINLGYDLSSAVNFPLTIGIGFMNQHLDLSNFPKAYDSDNSQGYIDESESVNSFAFSASTVYYATFSLGFTYKSINTDLAQIGGLDEVTGSGNAFDLGLLVSVPVVKDYELLDRIYANIDANLGWALQNFGNVVNYSNNMEEALPRKSTIGYSFSGKLDYKLDNISLELVKLDWSASASESLVYGNKTNIGYDTPFNEVDFVDNFIALNANRYVSTGFGWNISFLETISVLKGWSLSEIRLLPSDGMIITSKGIVKILHKKFNNSILEFVDNHLEINYALAVNTMPIIGTSNRWMYESYKGFIISYKF